MQNKITKNRTHFFELNKQNNRLCQMQEQHDLMIILKNYKLNYRFSIHRYRLHSYINSE